MKKLASKAPKRKGVVRKTFQKIETNLMAAVGRQEVRRRTRRAKAITRKAAKAALAAGALAAASVVLREVRKRRPV